MASHVRHVAGICATLTGLTLLAAFVAPFFGALDRAHVVDQNITQNKSDDIGSGGIVVEQFDYEEPTSDANNDGDQTDNSASPSSKSDFSAPSDQQQQDAPGAENTNEQPAPVEPTSENTAVPDNQAMRALNMAIATAAGRLESNGQVIELQGIAILPVSETCKSPAGEEWPCGMAARTAFRSWLRSRAVQCRLPDDGEHATFSTECRVGNEDPANWLVANGWARATATGPFSEIGKKAEQDRLGIFGDKPASALPSFDAGEAPSNPNTEDENVTPPSPTQDGTNGYFPPAPSQVTPKQ